MLLAQAAEPRLALVIGNTEYESGPLPNPANDAALIGDALHKLSFEIIVRRNNPFTRSMRSVDHGLATMDAPAGILIAYSTAPGAVAAASRFLGSPRRSQVVFISLRPLGERRK